MEVGKDSGRSHSWVEGAEVEADRWVDTSDPAALDAWGRNPSPEPAPKPAVEALQAPGDAERAPGALPGLLNAS